MLPQKPLQWEGKVASHTVALKVTYITPTHSALVSVSHTATCNLKRTEKCNPTMFPRVGVIYWMELETGYNGIPGMNSSNDYLNTSMGPTQISCLNSSPLVLSFLYRIFKSPGEDPLSLNFWLSSTDLLKIFLSMLP